MKHFFPSLVAGILVLLAGPARGEEVDLFKSDSENPALRYSIESVLYDKPREITVQLPVSYHAPEAKRYPVIYLLDGERAGRLKSVVSIARDLFQRHKMPEVIIVAITAGETRQLDYTPNDLEQHSSEEPGNADRFRRFLRDELTPHIDSEYRTYPFRVLSGHSRGGLFAVDDLLEGDGFFDAHIALSPALWEGDYAVIDRISRQTRTEDLSGTFLFVNAGGDEAANIREVYARMARIIADRRQSLPNWSATFHEHDSHGTTSFVGHYLALRALYTNWDRPWEEYESGGLNSIVESHEELSAEFGYPVIPDEKDIEGVGYEYLRSGRINEAVEAFRLYAHYHPDSPNAYDCLAEALESVGKLEEAQAHMVTALGLLGDRSDLQANWIRSHAATLNRVAGEGRRQH